MSFKEKAAKAISGKDLKESAYKIENSKAAAKIYGVIGKIPVLKKVHNLSLKKAKDHFYFRISCGHSRLGDGSQRIF